MKDRKIFQTIKGFLFLLVIIVPTGAYAKNAAPTKTPPAKSTSFEISGWIPYWRTATGTVDALAHLDTFKELSPFGYTVKRNGELFDALHADSPLWQTLVDAAHEKNIRIIPTVTWSNTDTIHTVLKSKKRRRAHIQQIMAAIREHHFDGIDIDYEGKKAETRPYFSAFLRDLSHALGKKWLICTIEARTPLDARFDTIPPDVEYANDYTAINRYCDRVRIMTYDQQSVDLRLNSAASGPYVPVADPQWVEKVIALTAKTISKKKIIIGIPTYGYEYEVTPLAQGYRYHLLWSFNPKYAMDLARQTSASPQRNRAGEMSFSYLAAFAGSALSSSRDTTQSNNDDLATTTFSSESALPVSTTSPFRLLWWSDAQAIKDKVALARKLGVRGIAIFKIDGGEDPGMWSALDVLRQER